MSVHLVISDISLISSQTTLKKTTRVI